MTCSIEECGGKTVARGLCGKHYQRLLSTGTTDAPATPPAKPCSIDDCESDAKTKGMCKRHYDRFWRTGSTEPAQQPVSFSALEGEEWREVPGHAGAYAVSSFGRVRSVGRKVTAGERVRSVADKILRPWSMPTGHLAVGLGGKAADRRLVHRLVLEAFVGPCPDGMEGCHNDGDPTNNRLENLRWDTRSGNIHDAIKHGTHPQASKTHCPRDHEYTEENTYYTPDGRRQCRICMKNSGRRNYLKRKLAAGQITDTEREELEAA